MDIEVNSLSEIKEMSGRDLDESINEETLVSGEKADGTFGVFKLFAAIKKGIDWITSIGGNKNFTGEVTINSKAVATTESVNNALATYKLTDFNPSTYSNDTDLYKGLVARAFAIKEYRIVEGEIVWNGHWYGFVRVFATTQTNGVVEVVNYTSTKQYNVQVRANSVDIYELTTKTDLINEADGIYFAPQNKTFRVSSKEQFNTLILQGLNGGSLVYDMIPLHAQGTIYHFGNYTSITISNISSTSVDVFIPTYCAVSVKSVKGGLTVTQI